jgi:hypothetical protein
VLDGDVKSPRQADGYALSILGSTSKVMKQFGTGSSPIALGGGNISVQSE